MSQAENGAMQLKVVEGLGKDIGRCFARIGPEDMERHGGGDRRYRRGQRQTHHACAR